MLNLKTKNILVTGGNGFLGSFVVEKLKLRGVPASNIFVPDFKNYDLRTAEACERAIKEIGSNLIIIHLAAKVGGIGFNQTHPAEAFYDNLIMSMHLMEAARKNDVEKFVAIGSVCAYPKLTPVPFKEDDLWNGYPEETNAPYGLAKKMMLVQAETYRRQYGLNAIYLLPVNLYGPKDSFDLEHGHVIPSLIRKVAAAKKENKNYIDVWGSGKASREFLYVEDASEGIILSAEKYDKPLPVNLGSGMEITIKELARTICRLMDFEGEIRWDSSKPDGQLRRCLDVSRAEKEFGFRAKTTFKEGLKKTIEWYKKNESVIA